MAKLFVKDTEITLISIREKDYISLTDIAKAKNPGDANGVIANWLRNRNTIEFLGIWEHLYNSNFKPLEFEGFMNEAGANAFTLSPQKWIESTNAIGIFETASSFLLYNFGDIAHNSGGITHISGDIARISGNIPLNFGEIPRISRETSGNSGETSLNCGRSSHIKKNTSPSLGDCPPVS